MNQKQSSPRPEPPVGELPRNVVLLGWASCLNDIASEMVYPLLPQFLLSVLGGNRLALGAVEGIADAVGSLLRLASGAWSDRVGTRKRFVVFGYAVAAVSRPAISLLTAPWQLLLARASDRLGKGVRTAPRDALISDSTAIAQRGRAFGFHRAMDHLGAAIGPLLAAAFLWWQPDQLRWLFALTAIPGLAVLVLLMVGLREPRAGQQATPEQAAAEPLGRNFRRYLLAIMVFTLGNSSDAFLLVRASELGVATPVLPLLWFAFHVVKSGGNLLGGRLVDARGAKSPLLAAWLLYALVYLGFAAATHEWQAWVLFLAYAAYYALAEPAEKTLVAALVGSRRSGLAFGWFHAAIGLAALPASLLFGGLYERFGAAVPFGCGALLAILAALLLGWLVQPHRLVAPATSPAGTGPPQGPNP